MTSDAETLSALAARVRDLEAKEEIRELFSMYGFTADTGDAQGWSEVWAEDAVFEMEAGSITGRAEFFNGIADPEGVHKRKIESRGSLHTTGEVTIRVDGDTAWAEGPTIVWVKAEQGFRPFTMSYNHWDLARIDGRWEIKYRRARAVGPGAAAEVYRDWKTTR